MDFLIGFVLDVVLMGLLLNVCYLLYGHWRRRRTNTEKFLFLGAVTILCINPILIASYLMNPSVAMVDMRSYANYLLGASLMILLVYAFRQVKNNEENLEALVEEKSRQLIESERLANIGKGVVKAEQEIRNPLVLISQAAYVAQEKKELNPDMIRVIRENVNKINDILTDLRVKSGVK